MQRQEGDLNKDLPLYYNSGMAVLNSYALAISILLLNSVCGSDHHFHKIFDRRLLEVHELSNLEDLVDKHHSGIQSQQAEVNVPILGCGPSAQFHEKIQELAPLSSYTEVAAMIHDEDQTCIIAHVKGFNIKAFNKYC